MANQLTHALLAAGTMALVNPLIGIEPVSWNIFLAGIIGMLMNIDCSGCRIFRGSPVCNSLGCGIFLTYLAFMIVYFGYAFAGWDLLTGILFSLALGVGIMMHLAAEYITGQKIFTVPNNLDLSGWIRKYDDKSEKFWSSWGRVGLKNSGLKDSHVNGISLAVLLFTIGFL